MKNGSLVINPGDLVRCAIKEDGKQIGITVPLWVIEVDFLMVTVSHVPMSVIIGKIGQYAFVTDRQARKRFLTDVSREDIIDVVWRS